MIAAQSVVPKQKLKIKFPSQRIEAIPAPQSFECGQQLSSSFDGKKASSAGNSKETSGAYKRRPEGVIVGGPQEKRRKMDRGMTQQCSALLKALMKHPAGWVFNEPVDPKALNIPDYFTIIKSPMDLGTIKSKLVKNTYLGIQEFVADIKLTFSNAMLYNPPSNNVHKMAEEMNEFFEARWKSLEEKWNQENFKVGHGKILSVRLKDVNEGRQSCPKTQLSRNSSFPKKLKPSEEKVVKVPLNAKATEVELPKAAQNCVNKYSGKNLQKGTSSGSGSGGRAHGSANTKPPLSPAACKCSSCGSIKCQCSLPSVSNHASSSDVTSERSLVGDLRVCSAVASKLDCQAKSTSTSQTSKSDPDSDGAVSALDDENVCPSSQLTTPATDAASDEGLLTPIFEAQMSPEKALRAAMLKRRFAETILKAKQKTLLDHGDKADPVKMQQEKENLERRQREEKAKIEAQVRAAEAAAKMKAEVELKKQREREREAARIALQKMEKTAEIELNLEILKELEILSGKSGSEKLIGAYGGTRVNPLHQLGLFIKDEYLEDDDDETVLNEDGEEGEILS
ncbi:transcription factor GTE12-like isoform X1 [Durio zibethinus]|uniref:Transcription factor GTE12-like isoform X1 n=1 Tax=Durio zibethinus TaxID=66656 RepID=A0A6P5WW65_DURZI|nr:transcription factor GTE12-like isoform X1 [Durio zibethinus]XP_022720340.1 transcription factor GTE12-like isoform X1 [Durio zibethinus]XP_022720341.1 transcription factor GTE12-like isoform X1 [Durio zibethinus]